MDRRSFLSLAAFSRFPWHHPLVSAGGMEFRVLRYGRSDRRYLLIHGNEATAREILNIHMLTHPGIGYIATNTAREIPVSGGKLDPNRMFSHAGVLANLKKENPAWSGEQIGAAAEKIDADVPKLIRLLEPPPGGLLVALHNNSEGYNVNEEVPVSDRSSIKEPARSHEFFLCTNPDDFDKLAKSPYNVVLQNQKPAEDDGSLSRLAAKRGFRYVNLEATLGAMEDQLERLRWLEDNL